MERLKLVRLVLSLLCYSRAPNLFQRNNCVGSIGKKNKIIEFKDCSDHSQDIFKVQIFLLGEICCIKNRTIFLKIYQLIVKISILGFVMKYRLVY